MIADDATITVKEKDHPYVSRGGVKLEHALTEFHIDPTGAICLDLGASTGGFTDCLLANGAKKVWAIDVGHNQLDFRLRGDKRVVSMEGVNAREIDPKAISDEIDLLTADVSFISLRLVIPPLLPMLSDKSLILLLVKPQFEAGREKVGKGGLVKDVRIHEEVINGLIEFFASLDLACHGITRSPISGRKGNIEYLMVLKRGLEISEGRILKFDIDSVSMNH